FAGILGGGANRGGVGQVAAGDPHVPQPMGRDERFESGRAVGHRDHVPAARRAQEHVATDETRCTGDDDAHHCFNRPAACSAYQAMVRVMPASSGTRGLYPRSVVAFSIDGTRKSISGPGCGLKTISDFEPVRRMIMFASSKLVIVPCGLPRLKACPM